MLGCASKNAWLGGSSGTGSSRADSGSSRANASGDSPGAELTRRSKWKRLRYARRASSLAARPVVDAVEDDVDERPQPVARHRAHYVPSPVDAPDRVC